jgi:Fic family protein
LDSAENPTGTSYRSLVRAFNADSAYPLISQLIEIERAAALLSNSGLVRNFGSNTALDIIASSTAATLRLSGWNVSDDEMEAKLLKASDTGEELEYEAAGRGYAELLRLIMARYDEIPFLESQIKYFQSLLLKYDPAAASHRRAYRRSDLEGGSSANWGLDRAPSAEIAAAEMARLVTWARDEIDGGEIPAPLTIALFLHQFLHLRPFVDGNGRLARALAVYLLVGAGYDHLRIASFEAALEGRRADCASALRSSTDDATPWIAFFLSVIADTQQAARAVLGDRGAFALTPRQERILEALRERGTAKMGEIITTTAIPRATAKKDLKGLLVRGYVAASGVGKGTVYRLGPRHRG